jgi:hypothetical protein
MSVELDEKRDQTATTGFPKAIQKGAQPLNKLSQNPTCLIPDHLLTLVNNPAAVCAIQLPEIELGRMDNEYIPSLRILLAERNGLESPQLLQEEDDPKKDSIYNWNRLINRHRLNAIRVELLSPSDRALIFLLAHETPSCGVYLIDYVQAPHLRKQGLGVEFLKNFGDLIKEIGYQYWWAEHHKHSEKDQSSHHFFVDKFGNYPLDCLRDEAFEQFLWIPRENRSDTNSIKFLNPWLELSCVKPEFLRIKKAA